MNSFAQNINYIAGLDTKYGSSVELYKNNIALQNTAHDVEIKFSYYNNSDSKIHDVIISEPGVVVGNINDALISFKSSVESELGGNKFTCTVSSSLTNFVINNIVEVNITINSIDDSLKVYGLEMKISEGSTVKYIISGIINDTLKLLPTLAMIENSTINKIKSLTVDNLEDIGIVAGNIADVQNAYENAQISIAKASEANASAIDANASMLIANASKDELEINVSLAEASKIAAELSAANASSLSASALTYKTDAETAMTNANADATSASNSAVEAFNYKNSAAQSVTDASALAASANNSADVALASKNSAILSESNAEASKVNSASSAASALSSANSADESKVSALASATIATTKALEANNSAVSASSSEISASLSADSALVSENNAEASAISADASEAIAIAKASEALVSASNALTNANSSEASNQSSIINATTSAEMATVATTKANEANTSSISSATSAAEALDSANSADLSESNALAHKNSALASSQSASDSEVSASISAASALASANSATNSASIATTKASEAVASSGSAETSATNALASETKSRKWASEAEDVPVEPGEYSAKHWASKAQLFAAGSADNVSYNNNISGLSSTNVKDALDEVVADIALKQDVLVTGTNIRTINGVDPLGSGNLEITIGSGGYAANVYLTTLVSATNGSYNQVSYTPEPTQTILSATVNNNEILMADYIFDGDVKATSIPAGEWAFHYHRRASSSAKDSYIRFEIFKRNSVETETVLFSHTTQSIENLTFEQDSILITQPIFTVDETDRIGIKVYASTTRTNDTTIDIAIGDGIAAYFTTPLEVRHNQLRARDVSDAHPISAISELQNVLDSKADESSVYTKVETDAKIVELAPATDISGKSDIGHTHSKNEVGLGNVDNTSDANKPVSSAQATAIGLKQDALISGTNIKTINGNSIVGSGNISTIQTSVSGNAGTATKLETIRSIAISGDASGSVNFDGSSDADIAITLNSNVTREGNTFNGISQLVKTGADGKLPAIDGSQLTGIDALPSQTGFDGKYLKTNGTVATWEVSDVYTHPTNHSPSIITQDSNNRFVSDAEKASWNGKQGPLTLKTINNNSILGSGNLDIGGTPAGTIITFASATAPTGYLKANGALLSRTTYSALFAAIGTTFGIGDGSTTFALPDLRGYFPRGWDDGRGIDTSRVFGSSQNDGYLNHSHTASQTSAGAHTHTIVVGGYSENVRITTSVGNPGSNSTSSTTSSSGAHTHTITVANSTTGTTETRPKNIALLYCIKY